MAMRNKMDISMNIAVSSSTQIALFVAPVCVFISLLMGHPLTFLFHNFELIAVTAAIAIAVLISLDGKSHWLEGVQLLATYIILALAFYFIAGHASSQPAPPPTSPSRQRPHSSLTPLSRRIRSESADAQATFVLAGETATCELPGKQTCLNKELIAA
jgi:hypothetical protein